MMPEARARHAIDTALDRAGWIVQDRAAINLHAGPGVAVRELPTATGPADYILFVDRKACGVLEAKPAGVTLDGVGAQAGGYAAAAPAGLPSWADPLPFLYVSTGAETTFRDGADPLPRPRRVFAPHRPETLRAILQAPKGRMRARLAAMPPLDRSTLRPCQADAVAGVEASLAAGRPRALVQMATGAGKTFAACALSHRLLGHAGVKRVLFLVDRANLGTQTAAAFGQFKPAGADLLFTEEYVVQHLAGGGVDDAASVVVSTIQRLYAALRGEELPPGADDRSGFEDGADEAVRPVSYSPALPPEAFDLVIVDECHRSIYGAWRQVLEYFDAFIVGLTATPGKHTYGWFQQNVVSEYPFERSVADGVNVGFEVFRIRTQLGEHGGVVDAGYQVPHRDRATRARRWDTLADDMPYTPGQLNRVVEAPNQVITVLQAFRDAVPTQLFPGRRELPKTLIFCRNDSHAETVTTLARQVLGLDERGVQKITYQSGDGQALIRAFRADHLFRVAVSVDMVATGTDLPPLEALIFLRDVRSKQYYAQMLGRGSRTIAPSDLRRATPSAPCKERFVVVDAVGLSADADTPQPLDRERSATVPHLLERIGFGHTDAALCDTVAARLARLARRLDAPALARIAAVPGAAPLPALARALVDAGDPLAIAGRAAADGTDADDAAAVLRGEACLPLASNPALRAAIMAEAARSEIIIDELSPDAVLSSGFDAARAGAVVQSFGEFMAGNRDAVAALAVLYGRPHAGRRLTYEALQDLAAAMARPPWLLTTAGVWQCYRRLHAGAVGNPSGYVTDLVALVRYALGHAPRLDPVGADVQRRFNLWLGREERAGRNYTEAQLQWLRLIRDHVAANAAAGPDSFRDNPALAFRGGFRAARSALGEARLVPLLDELSDTLLPLGQEAA